MGKNIWNVVLIFAVSMFLTGCGKSVLSEEELIDIIPENIIFYIMEDELYQSEVTNIEIEQREIITDTNDNANDNVDVVISLEDDYTERTVYATLYLEYYDTGEWRLNSWESYDDEICIPKIVPDESKIQAVAERSGISDIEKTDEMVDLPSGMYNCTYSINEEHTYVTFTGEIFVSAYYTYEWVDSDMGMITECSWEYEREDGGIVSCWDVLGFWTGTQGGKTDDGLYKRRFEATINNLNEEYVDKGSVSVSGNFYYAAVIPGSSTYTGEEIAKELKEEGSYWIEGEVSSDIYPLELHITLSTGYYAITFEFTADSVKVYGNDNNEYENITRN